MRSEFETIDAREPLESVVPRLQENAFRFLPVVENESLVGMITAENLSELFLIQTAMSQRKSPEWERLSSEAA
jgi:predicted transcriptional regulator